MNFVELAKSGVSNLYLSIKRFPYALLFSTLTTITILGIVNIGKNYNTVTIDTLKKVAMILALGFPLYLSIKLIFERKVDASRICRTLIHLTAAILLIIYYFFLLKDLNMVSTTRYIAINLALYLSFLIIPYFYRRKNFELYVIRILSRLSITLIYSIVLFSGLSMILFTINKLLNISITSELYISTWLIVIGIFAPIFLLAGIPHINNNIKEYPRLLEILLLYIVMPLITAYTSILYIYFIKILISRQWPEGIVAHLVLWYAVISIIVLFFISPIQKENKWVNFFITWFPLIIIPLLTIMFTAIGIRISTYGVTENRYFVILLGLWSTGIMSYYIFSRNRKNIILPLTLAVIALFSVFGPWSSYSFSINSQNKRFEKIIRKYDMINDNTIIKKGEKITGDDQIEINAILRYFEQNHQLGGIKYLPNNFSTKDTEDFFGFPYKANRYSNNNHRFFTYRLDNKAQVINTKNYDYLFKITNYNNEITQLESNITVKLNNLNEEISILQDNKEIYSLSLLPILIRIHKNNKGISYGDLNPENFIFINGKNSLNLKIVFNIITGTSKKSNPDDINIDNLDFFLLVSVKE